MTSAPDLRAVERNTVQVLPDATKGEGGAALFSWSIERGAIISPWGERTRERELRAWFLNQYGTLIQGAISALSKKVAGTPWKISGPKRAAQQYQTVLQEAHFGAGWTEFCSKLVLDVLIQDGGGYAELIAPGNPTKAPTGPIMSIANLDSLRCFPTGDPEYPVIYYNRVGELHLLHHTRVIHIVDTPMTDETHPGYGLSALSRAIAVVQRLGLMNQYMAARLDDRPLPGMYVTKGITERQWNDLWVKYKREQSSDMLPTWGRAMFVHAIAPDVPIEVTSVPFSQPPDNFDYAAYIDVAVNELALAIGVDKQELWELGSGNLGSGAQSEILHSKSQGKTIGWIRTELERKINRALPKACEFAFDEQDPYESQERAATAQIWAGVVSSLGNKLTPDEARLLLANQIEAVKDAITDADGELIRLNDADPKADPQAPQIVAVDASPVAPQAQSAPVDQAAQDSQKAIGATRLDFETDLEALLDQARTGNVDRRRFPILMRSIIRRQAMKAYQDGLIDGGVADGQMDEEDDATWTTLYADASAYVNSFWKSLYDRAGISDAQAAQRPELWWNKSLQPFYDAARASADKNGAYEWVLGATEEHCPDCLAMNGQVHRLKEYVRTGWMPKADRLTCKGFNCSCSLVHTDQRARGRFPKAA